MRVGLTEIYEKLSIMFLVDNRPLLEDQACSYSSDFTKLEWKHHAFKIDVCIMPSSSSNLYNSLYRLCIIHSNAFHNLLRFTNVTDFYFALVESVQVDSFVEAAQIS